MDGPEMYDKLIRNEIAPKAFGLVEETGKKGPAS